MTDAKAPNLIPLTIAEEGRGVGASEGLNPASTNTSSSAPPLTSSSTAIDSKDSTGSYFPQYKKSVKTDPSSGNSSGLFTTLVRYTKFSLCVLVVLILGSVFVNVWQLIAGDCTGLQAQLDTLTELNNELKAAVVELEKQNEEIQAQVEQFADSNTKLKTSISNLTAVNTDLSTRITSIETLATTLNELFDETTQTFEQFESRVLDSTKQLISDNEDLEANLVRMGVIKDEMNESYQELVANNELLLETYTLSVNTANNNFLLIRSSAARASGSMLGADGTTLSEYQVILQRCVDAFFTDEDSATTEPTVSLLQSLFPFSGTVDSSTGETEMDLVTLFSKISAIANYSLLNWPSLFIKNVFL